jgi:hypothetical protein
MSARVKWDKGGDASVVSFDAGTIVLRSSVPSPPGSRIEGVLPGDPPARIKVKVHSSKKQPEGDYLLAGRTIDATRETRERLEKE